MKMTTDERIKELWRGFKILDDKINSINTGAQTDIEDLEMKIDKLELKLLEHVGLHVKVLKQKVNQKERLN